jgi:hypothetical protein
MIRASKPGLLIALLAFWPVAVCAQSAPVPRSGSRVISGFVISGASGQPVAGADVVLRESGDLKIAAATSTDGDGRFEFTGIPDGRYRLTASRRGFVDSAYQEHEGGIATAIVTGEGLDTTNLRLALAPIAAIYGNVTEDSGDPVPQARITLYAPDSGTGRMRRAGAAMAGAMGHFDVPHVAPGSYYLCVSGTPWYAGPAPGTVSNASPPAALDMAYRTACYPDGVDPTAAELITVKPGDRIPLDLILHPVAAVHISLQLSSACGGRNAFPQLREEIFGISEFVQAAFAMSCNGGAQDSNATVTAYSYGIAPGQYKIELNTLEDGGPQNPMRATTVDASPGELKLDPASFATVPSLSGTVAVAGGNSLPTTISLVPAAEQAENDRVSARIGADGAFHLNGVPAGKYEVVLVGSREGALAVDRITAQGATTDGRTIEVGSAAATLSITARPANAAVSGNVESGGKPAAGVFLLLVPASSGAGRDAWRANQSDSDGSFEFRHVAPGDYILVAIQQGWTLAWARSGVIEPYLERGVPVTITPSSARIVLKSPLEAQPQSAATPRH